MRLVAVALLGMAVLSGCSYRIYSVNERPRLGTAGGILYALPCTEVGVDLSVASYEQSDAVYAAYAAEMVGASDSATTRAGVSISARNKPDGRAYYYVVPRRIAVDVNKDHLLLSVGLPTSDFAVAKREAALSAAPTLRTDHLGYNIYDRADTFYVKGDKPNQPSKVATKPDGRNLRQRAMAAAEELRDVQDRLRGIRNGDFDDSYTIEQMQYVQQRLEQREADLLRLFVGEPRVERFHFAYTPRDEHKMIDSQSVVLFYYSPVGGVVDSGAVGAVPVVMEVRCANQSRSAARFVKYRTDGRDGSKAKQRRCFKYRMAELAEVKLSCPYFCATATLPVVQFGPTVDLPKRRFEALFDPETGDLLYYNGRP